METYDPNAGDSMSTPIIQPEKNVEESQMADFSSPIEDVMTGPGQMMQDEVMGPSMPVQGGKRPVSRQNSEKKKGTRPFGMTDEQFTAVIAGISAIVAFSKPVQGKLSGMVPKFMNESGDLSLTGMLVSALVAAIVFYSAKQFLEEKA
jgi:hypothetical protein